MEEKKKITIHKLMKLINKQMTSLFVKFIKEGKYKGCFNEA